jgi:aryl-alcohol dehydrogenase-like predicted oxidoreductase
LSWGTPGEHILLGGKAGFTEHLATSYVGSARGWVDTDHCLSCDYLLWEFERQCRWLEVDALDMFLLQNPEEALGHGEKEQFWIAVKTAFRLFEGLREKGRLSFYGVSTAEAFRVPRNNPLHIALEDLYTAAELVGGTGHGFRVLEFPVNMAHLEAMEVRAHRIRTRGTWSDVSALEWAEHLDMIVLTSATLNGGWLLEELSRSVADMTPLQNPGAVQAQLVRSLPGVTTALLGIRSPEHLVALEELTGVDFHNWQFQLG